MDESRRFLMFGCWNKNECIMGSNANPLSRNMTYVKEFIRMNPTEFVLVAGDNYYPDKPEKNKDKDKDKTKDKEKKEKTKDKNKTKKINTRNLHSGFDCLRQLDTEVNVILGNHDLETRKSHQDKIIIDETREENLDECYIIKEEIKEHGGNIKLATHMHRRLNHTLIIMLDTTLYLPDNHKYETCYEHMVRNMDVLKTNQQHHIKKWIEEANRDPNIKNIIFVGHHPIVTYKQKEEMVIEILPGLIDFLQHIEIKSKKIFYLCADVHFFQHSTIELHSPIEYNTHTIEQIVVGTGGTTLDPIRSLSQGEMPTEKISSGLYFTHHESVEEYGFLEVIENGRELTFSFRQLPFVGGKKTNKRKMPRKTKKRIA
jgi:glycerol-3-phosphate cytidylyltransferase-like family protein